MPMPNPVRVRLTPFEVRIAKALGRERQSAAVAKKSADAHGLAPTADGENIHIIGAAGEIAAAKAMGVYPVFSEGSYLTPDLGFCEVKTRTDHQWDLIVRTDTPDDWAVVLVTGQIPEFRVCGWIHAHAGKRPEWLQTYGDREPAYFVPKHHLRPLNELVSLVLQPSAVPASRP